MDALIQRLKIIVTDSSIRARILFVLAALIVFRALAAIPVPGVDLLALEQFFANNQFLGLLNIFSGGGLANLSIVLLGVAPYITASIIMQLLTVMSPRIKALYSEEGETGKQKFMQYTRLFTLPLAVIQGFAFLTLLQSQGIVPDLSTFAFLANMVVIVTGSMLLMWIGELVTEFGIGNGVSIIIFAGIVAAIPTTVSQLLFTFDASQIPLYAGFIIAALLVVYGVVVMTEAERPVPITHAKQNRGGTTYGGTSSYIPLRLNQAGVIPIIFALSVILFPQMIVSALSNIDASWVTGVSNVLLAFFTNQVLYSIVYFGLVFLFTYFYTAVTFDPEAMAKNLQRSGGFVPGVRPGTQTAEYIGGLVTRLTFIGAIFLGAVAVLPLVMQVFTGVSALAIGGTALLIVVTVVLDLIRRIDSQISLREY